MCGIAGIVKWDGSPAVEADVHAMCDAIVHRGPDDEGVYAGAGAAIGMRRLSIIDLAGGHQPVHNEDRTIWVVFNGEIYNFVELRADLERRGHRFYTTSDTEAIVHLYEEFGDEAVQHLRGMFAFAVWDSKARRLLLARDRLGIKPLFYADVPGGLAFASEVKALLMAPGIEQRLDWPAVGHLFTFRTTPATQSVVRGVRKLDAGHRAVTTDGRRLRVDRYWDVRFDAPSARRERDLADELRARLEESVRLHLQSEVPLGAFLSGGVDSSAVVGLMSRLQPGRVKTFSIGFPEAPFDELAHARAAARAFDTEHHEYIVRPQAPEIIDDIVWHLDEPFGDSSAIPTYLVSRLAASHVTVVLTGDGGDEIFGGYDKYVVEQRERRYDRVPKTARRALGAVGRLLCAGAPGKRFLTHLAFDGAARYLDASTLFARSEQARLFTPDIFALVARTDPFEAAAAALNQQPQSWLSALQYGDLRGYLPLDILAKVDRMTMAHSIEARPPLLDHTLVEFAAALPADMRLRGVTTKYLFKQALRGLVPDTLIERRKQGFAVPIAQWFRGPWASFAADVLLSDTCRHRGIFRREYVEDVIDLNRRGRDMDAEIWTLLSFESWCRAFLDRPVVAPRAARGPRRPPVATQVVAQ